MYIRPVRDQSPQWRRDTSSRRLLPLRPRALSIGLTQISSVQGVNWVSIHLIQLLWRQPSSVRHLRNTERPAASLHRVSNAGPLALEANALPLSYVPPLGFSVHLSYSSVLYFDLWLHWRLGLFPLLTRADRILIASMAGYVLVISN